MPGICGFFSKEVSAADEAKLAKMLRCTVHDPSYRTGSYINHECGTAVAWTAHTGSFAQSAPIWSETRDVCLIFAGEDFSDENCVSGARGEGRYLVHRYQRSGISFLQQLNGWFSGVLLDLRRRIAVLFNDRFGLRRIYYHEGKDAFYFASEAKSLLAVLPETRQMDERGCAELLALGCAIENRTIFKGIYVLPPASQWTAVAGEIGRERYFRPEFWETQEVLDETSFYTALKETFLRRLPHYFSGAQAIGMSLTGGLDGRMIIASAKCPSGQLPCYTFGGTYRDCTDVVRARQVAAAAGQPHHVITVDETFYREFAKHAEESVYLSDGAMDVTGAVELYVNRIAKTIAPVRMTGNYGSEIFRGSVAFGPRRLNPQLYKAYYLKLGEAAASAYHRERQGKRLSFIAFKQVPWHHTSRLSVEQTQLVMRSPFLDNELVSLMYRAPLTLAQSPQPALRIVAESNPRLGRIPTDRDLLYNPTPIVSMLRNRYQNFTFKAEYAYDYGMPQWLAKIDHLLRPLRLERLFLGRHKFQHFRIWYREQLSPFVRDVLLDPKTLSRAPFRVGGLEKLVTDHLCGHANHTSELHQAFTYELIQRHLIERNWSES